MSNVMVDKTVSNNEITGKRKEKILEAALLCFNEKGYHKTSIDDIALKGKISKGGIYYHFKSKDELFLKLFHFRLEKYTEQLKSYIQEESDPVKRIRILIKKWGLILLSLKGGKVFILQYGHHMHKTSRSFIMILAELTHTILRG